MIDLRSDTVTRPSPEMRAAMASAPVGDDVFGDDPTVNLLQERAAALLGKEAALFVPSGTAANQIALLTHCRPGDEVLVGGGAQQMAFESGGGGALAGVQFTVVSAEGIFGRAALLENVKPADNPHYPPTRLVSVEDTHNRSGGRVWPLEELHAVVGAALGAGLAVHLDGARLMNAVVASGTPASERAAGFDTVSLCFSKGLGAPIGSVLAGSRALLRIAHRYRKMLGGGMRQAGIIAAAALYALDHHVARLSEDHANARALAATIAGAAHARVTTPETNIVFIEIGEGGPTAGEVVARAAERDVLVTSMGPRTLRAVTHLDVDSAACARAATILGELLDRK